MDIHISIRDGLAERAASATLYLKIIKMTNAFLRRHELEIKKGLPLANGKEGEAVREQP